MKVILLKCIKMQEKKTKMKEDLQVKIYNASNNLFNILYSFQDFRIVTF